VAVGASTVVLDTVNQAVVVDGDSFAIGDATRGEIEAALGVGVADGENTFWSNHCAERLQLQYADDVDTGADLFEGTASAGDVLARVVVLEDGTASTSAGTSLGDTRAAAVAAEATSVTHDRSGLTLDFSPSKGLLVVSRGGNVVGITLARAQDADYWSLPIDLPEGVVGGITIGDATFNDVTDVLGDGFDAESRVSFAGPIGDVFARVRIYPALGVRLVGVCLFGACGTGSDVSQIALSPPYMGLTSDAIPVGIGSSRADVDAALGTGETNEDGITVYDTQPEAVGVVFTQAEDCVERAAAIILGYVPF